MNKLKLLITKEFWDDAGIRAIRTFFQAALAFIGVNVAAITEIDYIGAASIGAGAALISVAQSIIQVATAKIEEDPFIPEEELQAFEVDEEGRVIEEVVEEAINKEME